jgi:5-formyltetrahydrofolate cyclo-ligase
MDAKNEKAKLRAAIVERLSAMQDDDRRSESRSICRRILQELPESPGLLFAYSPLKSEPDIRPALNELLKKGWRIALPALEDGNIVFRGVENLDDLVPGPSGALEPSSFAPVHPSTGSGQASTPVASRESPVVALIPGRAFDRKLHRLGRGNGGFDRWISQHRTVSPETKYWAVAFECQLVNEVPTESHDEKMDVVITARGIATGD